jgi:hypothetical protein
MTMINFKRTGGTMDREMTMDFDLGSLPASVERRLNNLLADSNFFEIPSVDSVLSNPDDHEYVITVVSGNAIHTVRVSDSSMPHSLRPLVEELTQLAEATT